MHREGGIGTVVAIALMMATVTAARAKDDVALDVKKHVLANGMTILVVERKAAPVFATYMHYKVGSANEWPGMIGAAHLLEHMLFKGTQAIGTKNYEREVPLLVCEDSLRAVIELEQRADTMAYFQRSIGLKDVPDHHARLAVLDTQLDSVKKALDGFVVKSEYEQLYDRNGATGFNAGTGYDGTTYYVSFPSNRLPLYFTVEADRMAHPVLREFYAEREVVMEERRLRVDNEGSAKLFEQLIGTAFIAHPYQIFWEWPSEVRHLTRPKVMDFYRKYYAPNRMVLAIVGDVDANEVFQRAEAAFDAIPRQPDPDPVFTVEPPQEGERRVIQEFDAEPYLSVAYHKTSFDDPDEMVFRVIHRLLSDGRTSRLYKSLVLDKQIALSVSTYEYPGSDAGDLNPNLFVIDAEPKSPHTTLEVETALYEELDRLATTPVEPRELEKIKNRIAADFIWSLYSNLGLASQVAEYEARAGDWRYLLSVRDRLAKVTPADIMRVAKTAFRPENRTVATLVPKKPES
ncbi:MAG: insulinase family protein [candidate division Zixibacteria bacterium]|nr:insulinase family protein [candidate division Zixibacteria bacterium]